MRAKIFKIGNSQGILIPKTLLKQTGLGEEVELEGRDKQIIIRPVTYPRQGRMRRFEQQRSVGTIIYRMMT